MKHAFEGTLKIFKYAVILFTIGYWIFMVIDDYSLWKMYWRTNWQDYLVIWFLYFIACLVSFTFYFWICSSVVIVIYHKLIKRK